MVKLSFTNAGYAKRSFLNKRAFAVTNATNTCHLAVNPPPTTTMNDAITVSIERSGQRSPTLHGGLSMKEAEELIRQSFSKHRRATARKGSELVGECFKFDGYWNWFFETQQ